ncbi:CRISPR-associated endonuclease Cas1 [Syntrophotalea acetylenica]|uniref:CRISPR-associated endonuclease Cas1 n=1 Tax=Syntrophotalea acetylenica TaxID=29542 RepID=UPI002A35FF46|nr:CRISPR-associated endonuclease Cas1 [Syntrophotalea acetylenica]MDY0261384.1 CRISPR-associated endonuclease Cas1 [Syntrophotalea acetylenica]
MPNPSEVAAMIVYVTAQGSQVVREGRHLLVRQEETVYHTLFIHKLEQLVLCGNVTLTPGALNLLLRENVDTVFLRLDGRYKGRLALDEQKNVFLRRRQFQLVDDIAFCMGTAGRIVQGKLLNMVTVLQRIKRTRSSSGAEAAVQGVRKILARLPEVEGLDVLRGMEGQASACYFAGLRHGLDEDFGFRKRVRRPPTDPVNSVLSLLYTFLINRMYAAVRLAGLDPYPGVLHALDYGRQALPLDLVEEFRAPLADTVALALFNLRALKKEDFYVLQPPEPLLPQQPETDLDAVAHDPLGQRTELEDDEELFDMPDQQLEPPIDEIEGRKGKGAVRLVPAAFKKVINAFEKKMQTEFFHPGAQRRMSYADALVFQARQYRRLVEGEAGEYHPLLFK